MSSSLKKMLGLKEGGDTSRLKDMLGLAPKMAKGGVVHMQDGGDPTQMFNFNPMAAKAAEQERRRREAVEAKRYKSVMGTTPQDLLRRVEPPPAEMTETPQSVMPTTLDRAVVGGLRALGAPAPQARGINQLLSKSVGMLVPDPERIYNQMSEAVKEDDYSKMIGPSIDAAIGYVPLIGPAARLAMPPVKAATTSALDFGRTAGREMLRPIDQAMFGEGPLASLIAPVTPLQAVPRVQAPVSRLGFYDPVEQAGLNIQRKQGPGQAFLNELQRSENVSKDFLEASGIAEKLRTAPNITREEVQKLTKGAVPEIEEVVKGGKQDFDANRLNDLESQYKSLNQHPIDDPNFGEEKYNEMIRLMNIRDQSSVSSLYAKAERAENYAREAQKSGDKKLAEAYFREAELLNTRAEKLDLEGEGLLEPTKYGQGNLQLPGGDNYREVLLKVPKKAPTTNDIAMSLFNKEMRFLSEAEKQKVVDESRRIFDETPKEYRSTHWEEPNVVSHIRMNDRTDANGKKVLFIEEIQSDWAQQGRKEGFEPKGRRTPKQIETEITKINRERSRLIDEAAALPDSQMADFLKMNEQIKKLSVDLRALQDEWDVSVARPNVPRGPFVTNTNEWVDLSLKNILKRAVDEGYDRVAFINGKQSADRYKLTNYVDRVEFLRRSGGISPGPEKMGDGLLIAYDKQGRRAIEKYINDPERELPDVIGKEASQKLLEQKPEQTRFAGEGAAKWSLQGAGLEVGGKGMKDFYDRIVPDRLKKIAKQDLKPIDVGTRERRFEGESEMPEGRPIGIRELNNGMLTLDLEGSSTGWGMWSPSERQNAERALKRFQQKYSESVPQQLGIDITPEIREKFSKPIPYKEGGAVKRVHISDNPDTMLLELTRAPKMQAGGKPPPGVRRAMAQQRGTVAPIPGIKTPAEFIGGYVGADPRFSVMDPDAEALERAYRAGEATSVIGDIVGSISPFATASTLARANALPGAAVVKAGTKKPPNVMAEFEKALAKSGPPTPAQIKKADAAEERVKKEKKFAKLRPSEQRQAIEAARSEALGTTVDRSSKVLKALLPGEEDIMTSLQGIKGYEVAKAVPAYAVKEAKVKRAKLREEPPTTPGASASEKEWQDWGKQFGVDMTLSKPVSLGISDPVAKREVKIPGGLEGTFTIPDMFWMKANNVNPAALPKDVHDKLMLKFIRTHTVAEPDEVDIFNRLNFALLSPNAPLTSNEFLAMRARIRDKDELERLAARSGEEGLSKKMAEELGVQSGAKGGMGVLGTADLANQAELARMILQKPEMFMIQPSETMRDVTMRVMNQVPGLGPKTASLATPWLDLERANTSAVDLHMIRDATPRLLTDPDVGAAFRARMGKLLGVEPTMEAILAQPPSKVQEKAVQIVGGSDVSKVYRTKTGALNEIPEAALPEKLVYEPSALSNFNPFYSKVVEYVDESRGANPVLELFPEQWRKWDVIRERIEPHEFAHPDYRKLPKQSFSEMKAASDEHTAAGYRGQRPVMDETDWRKLYYGSLAPIGVGLGAGALSEMDTGTD